VEPAASPAQDDPGLPAPTSGGQNALHAIHSAAGESLSTPGPFPYAQDRSWAIAPSALHPVAVDCACFSGQTRALLPITSSNHITCMEHEEEEDVFPYLRSLCFVLTSRF
jgi:hypothetical protein